MNTKSISPISMFIVSTFLLLSGCYMLYDPINIELIIIKLIHIIFITIGILSIIIYTFNKDKKQVKPLLSGILWILLGMIIRYKIIFIEKSLVVMIGIYAFMNFMAQVIGAVILYSNKAKQWIFQGISSLVSFIFSMILIFYPFESRVIISKIAAVYIILFALTVFNDFMNELSDTSRIKENLKRKIRIRLPIIYTAFIPQKLLEKINDSLEISSNQVFVESKSDDNGELEVFIHLANECANGFGHIDICYKNTIYCYGSYDDTSHRFLDLVSDGVLIEGPRDKYIEFNTRTRHLVSFVLSLDLNQCRAVENKIKELKNACIGWSCESKLNPYKEYNDYTNNLYLATKCKFYKFKYGFFKTYFALTTNCVKLADTIVGSAGIDAICINGIITPGIYYNFLNKLFNMNNSMVIRRNVYNMYDPYSK